MKINAFPTNVDFALTGRCNLRCKHCNTSDTWAIENELSFDEIISVFDRLKDERIFSLTIFGGEPFCHPRIFDIFDRLNKYPFRFSILTNGTLIDKDAVKRLKCLRFFAGIQVSIDGSSAEVHDWQRGPGSFSSAMRGVELLHKSGLDVTIKAIINTVNYKDIENMVKLAIGLGLDGMDFGDAVECGRAAVFADKMRFAGDMHKEIMTTMFELAKKYPDFSFGGTLSQKMQMLEDFYEKGPGGGDRGNFSTCPAGQNMLSIRSDGKVVPCSAFWTLVCGDMRKESLKDIWEGSKVLNAIRALAEEPLDKHHSACGTCDYLSFCNGGCRAAAYYANDHDLKGIEESTCLVFSGNYPYRVSRETVPLSLKRAK